jgi:hypothetical protein
LKKNLTAPDVPASTPKTIAPDVPAPAPESASTPKIIAPDVPATEQAMRRLRPRPNKHTSDAPATAPAAPLASDSVAAARRAPFLQNMPTLIIMLLKEKLDMSFLRDRQRLIFKIVFTLLSFAVAIAALTLVLKITVLFHILTISSILPQKIMTFIFAVLFIVSLISVTLGLAKNLYFADDNKILLTYPVKASYVFFSKVIVYYIGELKRNFSFLVPVFFAFGITNGYGLAYFLVVIFGFLFISLLTVVLAAILSIPAMFSIMFLRRFAYLQTLLFAILLSLITVVVFRVVAAIPPELNILRNFARYYWDIQNALTAFGNTFAPLASLTSMLVGVIVLPYRHAVLPTSSLITFVWLLGIVLAGIAVIWFVARPLFFKMASRQFEHYKRSGTVRKRNKRHSPFVSSLKKEALQILRTPRLFFNYFVFLFILPLAILLLNKLFAHMDTRLSGDLMAISINILMILLILLSGNISAASVLSGEGAAIYLLKTKPARLKSTLLSKLSLSYLLSVISIALTCVIMLSTLNMRIGDIILIFFTVLFIHTAHILWSVDLDIMNPQYNKYFDGAHEGTNPNEVKSVLIAFMLSFVFFAVTLFLILENPAAVYFKITALALAVLLLRIYLSFSRIKVYFKND